MGRLENRNALITGGTTGIGYAAAQAMIAEGARVAITGQDQQRVEEAARSLGHRTILASCLAKKLFSMAAGLAFNHMQRVQKR